MAVAMDIRLSSGYLCDTGCCWTVRMSSAWASDLQVPAGWQRSDRISRIVRQRCCFEEAERRYGVCLGQSLDWVLVR